MLISGLIARGPPALPNYLLYTKAAFLLLSIIVLALAVYGISIEKHVLYHDSSVLGYLIFLVIFTWTIYGIPIVIERKQPRLYYRLAVLTAYALCSVFWLTGWAWSASWASYILSFSKGNDGNRYGDVWNTLGSLMGACAGLGALIWLLTIVEFGFFCHFCLLDFNSTHIGYAGSDQDHLHSQHQIQTPRPSQQSYTTQSVYGGQSPTRLEHSPLK